MIITKSQMHRTDRYSQHSSIIWPFWLNGWVFVYKLNGCGLESGCCHSNIDVYTVEYLVMGFGMNGRKPTCISATLTEDNNDITHTYDGTMFLSPTLWCNVRFWSKSV